MAKHKEPFLDLKPRTADEKGKYVLMIFRPVPFGYGVMVFFIDKLLDKGGGEAGSFREAYLGKELLVRFPATFDYLLTSRDQFEFREPEPEEEVKPEAEPDPDRIGPISHL